MDAKVKGAIEKLLGDFWDKRFLEIQDDPLAVEDMGAPMDSLAACDAFIGIDKLVGQKIPVELIVRHGGYQSKDQFVSEITNGVINHLEGGAGG
nr:hypothetical protein [uncultured Pseudomonas sp.]